MDIIKGFIKSIFIYGFFLLSIVGICFWLWKNPIYNPVGPRVQTPTSQIDIKFKDVIVKGRKDGVPHWILRSKNVESERGTSRVFFKDKPEGDFYNLKDWSKTDSQIETKESKDRSRSFSWKSESAECNMDTNDLTLRDKVKILTDDKDKIDSDEIVWLNQQEKVFSNKRTKIVSAKGSPEIKADKLEGDVKLDLLKLKGNVEISTELNEEQQL